MRILLFTSMLFALPANAHFTGNLYKHPTNHDVPYLHELLLDQHASEVTGISTIDDQFYPMEITPDPKIQNMIEGISAESFREIIDRLSGELPLRDGEEPLKNRFSRYEGVVRAGEWISERFRLAGIEVRFHEYQPYEELRVIKKIYGNDTKFQPTLKRIEEVIASDNNPIWKNVVASIPGILPNKRLIIGAHYDSIVQWGLTERQPGADDNASGSAAVMLIAEAFAKAGISSLATIEFITFSGEELGLFGSAAYARYLKSQSVDVVGMINLDMIAFDSDSNYHFDIHSGKTEKERAIAQLAAGIPKAYSLFTVPQILVRNAVSASDHASFWRYNQPAIFITEDYCSGVVDECPDKWFDFNTNLHTIDDTTDKMNFSYGIEMTRTVAATLAHIAENIR